MRSIIVAVVLGCIAFVLSHQPATQANQQSQFVDVPAFDQATADQIAAHESELASLRSDVASIRQQVADVESAQGQCQCGPDCPCLAPQSTPDETSIPVSFGETYCDPETGVCYQVSSDGSRTAGTCTDGTCGTASGDDGGGSQGRDGFIRRVWQRIRARRGR